MTRKDSSVPRKSSSTGTGGKGKQFFEALRANRPVLLALYSEDSLLRYQVWKRFHSKGEYTLEDLSREMRSC